MPTSRSKVAFSPRLVRQNGNRNIVQSYRSRGSRSRGSRSRGSRSPQSEYAKTSSKSRSVKHHVRLSRASSVRKAYSAIRSRAIITNAQKKAQSIRVSRRRLGIITEE